MMGNLMIYIYNNALVETCVSFLFFGVVATKNNVCVCVGNNEK
jgi:hypothetical protein